MSARHGWLRFVTGGAPLARSLSSDPRAWQHDVSALQARWYDGVAPPAVAAVFVLQWLLQVPAHTAAHAAAVGPWRATGLETLTFSLGGALSPVEVRLGPLVTDARVLDARLDAAAEDYRDVAQLLARGYPSLVPLGPRTRAALVADMWEAARRDAEAAAGVLRPGVLARASCCLVYALPGCLECAGCPRTRTSAPRHGHSR